MLSRAVIAAAFVLSASAATATTYTVTIPEPADAFDYFGAGDASVTYDGVVLSQSAALSDGGLFNVGSGFSGAAAVLSSQQQSTGIPNILITLPVAAYAATLEFGTFGGSAVTFLLSNGDLSVLGSTGGLGYAVVDTYASGTTSPFTTILVTSTGQELLDIGTLTYSTNVPEPASWALMIGGFALTGLALRRRVGTVAA